MPNVQNASIIEGLSLPPGGMLLSQVTDDRVSVGLYGPFGIGKTMAAATFGGGDDRKIIHINVEAGPQEGPGGALTLLNAHRVYPRILPHNVLKLDVRSWADMQAIFRWLRGNATQLSERGFRVLILDGGSALSALIRTACMAIPDGTPTGAQRTDRAFRLNTLVTTVDEQRTHPFERGDYDAVYDRYMDMHSKLKLLPFTFVTTFLEKKAHDRDGNEIGVGPKLVGQQLPEAVPAEVDMFFHCETNERGEYVWLTQNNPRAPRVIGQVANPFIAKHRFPGMLEKYEPADGEGLMKKLGLLP